MEPYSLNEFGSWLCSRAPAYQNAHFLAADQTKSGSSSRVQERHSRNHHIGARTENVIAPQLDEKPNKPFCLKCNAELCPGDCKDFRALSLPDKLGFRRSPSSLLLLFWSKARRQDLQIQMMWYILDVKENIISSCTMLTLLHLHLQQ